MRALPSSQRAALEGRVRSAEDQLAAAERRHSLEQERLHSRLDLLEQTLESERLLVQRAQQQLQAELIRSKGLAEAEAAARAAEAEVQDKLEAAKRVRGERREGFRLPACLPCLPACPPICLPACLPALPACPPICLPACV